ncbi:MAG TPA: TetR family transcriptional regulator, partial [Acidimicrobiales bacterium]|nr:TetR family transcriptional regulator [Acidimicrobiales bacterium]
MRTLSTWLADERDALATDRILDAAGRLFAEHGVGAVGMADIASAAGCSRATVYRYFENRSSLQTAFVHREARRLGAAVAQQVRGVRSP